MANGRWRFRYSLRTLLIVVTLASIAMSFVGRSFRRVAREKAAVALLEEFEAAAVPARPSWEHVLLRYIDVSFRSSEHMPGDEDLGPLAELKYLEKLDLSGSKVTDNGLDFLKTLTSLRILRLERTAITDDGVAALSEMDFLEELNLVDTKITRDGFIRLMKAIPRTSLGWYRTSDWARSAQLEGSGDSSGAESADQTPLGLPPGCARGQNGLAEEALAR